MDETNTRNCFIWILRRFETRVMKVIGTDIPDVLLLEPPVFPDERGYFSESWNARTFQNLVQLDVQFVQDNDSRSRHGVLRGLHYQISQPQGKLIRVSRGSVFDVAVDLRKSSPSFGRWVGMELSEDNHRQLWIPPGFAHGYLVQSTVAEVLYKTTDYYAPEHERCLIWNDANVAIKWPLDGEPILSARDKLGMPFDKAEVFA
jgi:dTDP-4-dehydrorhamnose 3,5-epimerase